MNAFIKKEIRLLLPNFIIGVALAFSASLIVDDTKSSSNFRVFLNVFPFFISPMLLMMMALDSFGHEISVGTFSNLLSQPISRSKIWWTKTLLLAAAFLIVWMTWSLSFFCNKNIILVENDLREALLTTILLPLVVYSGGLWTVLLLRQVASAFWFTLIVPAALAMGAMTFAEKFSSVESVEPTIITVLIIYSIAGFIFARWLFLRAQDVQWTGGVIALPEFRRVVKSKAAGRIWHPRLSLFFKEIQLHQSQLIMAGVLIVLHLGAILMRKFGGSFAKQPAMEMLLSGFWMLWLAMPLLIGCAAVAEERKLGTLESQLCLPARRRTQFGIKFVTAMLLSLFLGLAVPFLLEGSRILPDFHPKFLTSLSERFLLPGAGDLNHATGNALVFLNFALPTLILIGIVSVIAAVSFYASTLSRNTLQSLAPAILGIMVTFWLLIGATKVEKLFPILLWRGWLIYLIGVPVMTLILLALMYWNFKHVLLGWKVWRRNAVVFVVSLVFVIGTTSAIYHRTWEFLTPMEPTHGAARLSSSDSVTLQSSGNAITVQFPDGKVWSGIFVPNISSLTTMLLGNWKLQPKFGGGKFLDATNWASISPSYQSAIGVRKDGSLWVSEKPREGPETETPKLVRFGEESDWKEVAGNFPIAFLLKQDGTLWALDTKAWAWNRRKAWPGIQALKLQRLGTNSDWAKISQLEWRTAFRKADGRTWIYPPISNTDTTNVKLDDKISIGRTKYLDGIKSCVWVSCGSGYSGRFEGGAGEDGKLSVATDWQSENGRFYFAKPRVQLGQETNWLAVAGGMGKIAVALKADGSLWKWKITDDPMTHPESASAIRLGKQSDWIAIAEEFNSALGLAADGSLWFWQFDSSYFSPESFPPLLAASRKPQKIGNIFNARKVP